jgi:hypothetical protein
MPPSNNAEESFYLAILLRYTDASPQMAGKHARSKSDMSSAQSWVDPTLSAPDGQHTDQDLDYSNHLERWLLSMDETRVLESMYEQVRQGMSEGLLSLWLSSDI